MALNPKKQRLDAFAGTASHRGVVTALPSPASFSNNWVTLLPSGLSGTRKDRCLSYSRNDIRLLRPHLAPRPASSPSICSLSNNYLFMVPGALAWLFWQRPALWPIAGAGRRSRLRRVRLLNARWYSKHSVLFVAECLLRYCTAHWCFLCPGALVWRWT